MKQEIILAIYLNVGNISVSEVEHYVENTKKHIKIDSEQIHTHLMIIPTRDELTRVECIYPKYSVVDSGDILKELNEINNFLKTYSEHLSNTSE